MSWLFSQALVAAFSEATCSDGAPFAPSSGTPTPQAYSWPDKTTAFSRPSRFGMTFRPLMDALGEAVLTWCRAVSRARTSQWQAREPESTEPAAECGVTWRGSLARFDPATSSWRTAQPSLLEGWGESSVIWPRSGMTASGQCWELPTLGRRISGTGSGLSERWPTPQTRGFTNDGDLMALGKMCNSWEEMSAMAYRASEKKKAMYWPTPTVCGNYNRKGASASSGDGLATAVAKFPTPSTLGINGGSHSRAAAVKRGQDATEVNGGSLNPTWVEWLMGWPLGWTDLKPLATGRSHCAPQRLSDC